MPGMGQLPAVPFPQVLFRPEEVVLSSGSYPVNETPFRRHPCKPAAVDLNADRVNAVGAGVFQGQPTVPVLAADQQQEIHRSRHAEPLSVIQAHGMEGEPQAFREPAPVPGQLVPGWTAAVGDCEETEAAQHPEGVMHLVHRDS